jgi:hypothetical protein
MSNPFVIRSVVSATGDHWEANDLSCFERGGSITAGLQGIAPVSSVLMSLSEALSQIRYFMTVRNDIFDKKDCVLLVNVELALQMAVLEENWSK